MPQIYHSACHMQCSCDYAKLIKMYTVCLCYYVIKTHWYQLHCEPDLQYGSSSSLCAIRSQQVGCHGSPSFSILCHSDTVIIWYFCPFLDVIGPHCSRSPPSSSTIYPSFHQQSLYAISSYGCMDHNGLNKLLYRKLKSVSCLRQNPWAHHHLSLGSMLF